jgi:phospholipase C
MTTVLTVTHSSGRLSMTFTKRQGIETNKRHTLFGQRAIFRGGLKLLEPSQRVIVEVFQDTNNFDDNPLAWFQQFQTASKNSPLAKKGMSSS